jgi:ferredoxin
MDAWHWVTAKVFKRRDVERDPSGSLRIKYFVLGGIFLLALAGIQAAWFFDPLTIFVRTFSFIVHPFINNGVDKAFAFTLQTAGFSGPLESAYYTLKDTVLDVSNPVFPHTLAIGGFFVLLLAGAQVKRRFWCRYLCPLGALLAVPARFALFRRRISSCSGACSVCKNACRTNAIESGASYRSEECILCMDCVAKCPGQHTRFSFRPDRPSAPAEPEPGSMTRKEFLAFMGGSLAFLGKKQPAGLLPSARPVLRPAGALPEAEFVQRCIRCGNCMKVCLTNTLQPSLFESGWQGIWTPYINTNIGYCEYQCTMCGTVCPTCAIAPLSAEEKARIKIGTATVHHDRCIPWALEEECLVCEEQCPIGDKAIKMVEKINRNGKRIKQPVVDASLCVGCGMCSNKCPVKPDKAITVTPL